MTLEGTMQQTYKQPQRGRKTEDVTADTRPADADAQEQRAKMSDDIDALLDEIDGVLEVNAETFVAQYVQGGGQ